MIVKKGGDMKHQYRKETIIKAVAVCLVAFFFMLLLSGEMGFFGALFYTWFILSLFFGGFRIVGYLDDWRANFDPLIDGLGIGVFLVWMALGDYPDYEPRNEAESEARLAAFFSTLFLGVAVYANFVYLWLLLRQPMVQSWAHKLAVKHGVADADKAEYEEALDYMELEEGFTEDELADRYHEKSQEPGQGEPGRFSEQQKQLNRAHSILKRYAKR